MNPLLIFYRNVNERESVRLYMIDVLESIAVEKAFDGEDTTGIKEAKDCIDRMFSRLEEEYGDKPQPINTNSR